MEGSDGTSNGGSREGSKQVHKPTAPYSYTYAPPFYSPILPKDPAMKTANSSTLSSLHLSPYNDFYGSSSGSSGEFTSSMAMRAGGVNMLSNQTSHSHLGWRGHNSNVGDMFTHGQTSAWGYQPNYIVYPHNMSSPSLLPNQHMNPTSFGGSSNSGMDRSRGAPTGGYATRGTPNPYLDFDCPEFHKKTYELTHGISYVTSSPRDLSSPRNDLMQQPYASSPQPGVSNYWPAVGSGAAGSIIHQQPPPPPPPAVDNRYRFSRDDVDKPVIEKVAEDALNLEDVNFDELFESEPWDGMVDEDYRAQSADQGAPEPVVDVKLEPAVPPPVCAPAAMKEPSPKKRHQAQQQPMQWNPFHEHLKNVITKDGKKFTKVPIVGGRRLDLKRLLISVQDLGGHINVTQKKLWRGIALQMDIPMSCTNAGHLLRKYYTNFLAPYIHELLEYISLPVDVDSSGSGSVGSTAASAQIVGVTQSLVEDDAPGRGSFSEDKTAASSKMKSKSMSNSARYKRSEGELNVRIGDFIAVASYGSKKSGDQELRIARVLAFGGSSDTEVMLSVTWFYRPRDIPEIMAPCYGEFEVFSTQVLGDCQMNEVVYVCNLHTFSKWDALPQRTVRDYYCRYKYCPNELEKLQPVEETPLVVCTCLQPVNPDRPMLRCTTCNRLFHPEHVMSHFDKSTAQRLSMFLRIGKVDMQDAESSSNEFVCPGCENESAEGVTEADPSSSGAPYRFSFKPGSRLSASSRTVSSGTNLANILENVELKDEDIATETRPDDSGYSLFGACMVDQVVSIFNAPSRAWEMAVIKDFDSTVKYFEIEFPEAVPKCKPVWMPLSSCDLKWGSWSASDKTNRIYDQSLGSLGSIARTGKTAAYVMRRGSRRRSSNKVQQLNEDGFPGSSERMTSSPISKKRSSSELDGGYRDSNTPTKRSNSTILTSPPHGGALSDLRTELSSNWSVDTGKTHSGRDSGEIPISVIATPRPAQDNTIAPLEDLDILDFDIPDELVHTIFSGGDMFTVGSP